MLISIKQHQLESHRVNLAAIKPSPHQTVLIGVNFRQAFGPKIGFSCCSVDS